MRERACGMRNLWIKIKGVVGFVGWQNLSGIRLKSAEINSLNTHVIWGNDV